MLIVAGLVAAVAVLVSTRPDGADVALARKQTQQAIAHATDVLAVNKSLKVEADSARAEAARHEQKAVQAQSQLAVAKRDLFKAALAAPDTCGPVVLAAQNALAEADKTIAEKNDALISMTVADLKDRDRADKAEEALVGLVKPAKALVSASHESVWHKLRPELQVGVHAGMDIQGKPNAVVGIGFGWHF